jgi:holo-[acyl-carrier protein] synthase
MILGVGVDLCPISRMKQVLARHGERIERRLFTEGERAYALARGKPEESFAARFAAKEAAFKALGREGVWWHNLEVTMRGPAPELVLHGIAIEAAQALGVRRIHLSLTHAGDSAIAVVILEA